MKWAVWLQLSQQYSPSPCRGGLAPPQQGKGCRRSLAPTNPSLCPEFTLYSQSYSVLSASNIPFHPPAGLRLEGGRGKGTHNDK